MSSTIHLEIVTPDKNFYSGDVKMFVIETTEGEIGVLNDHEPLVTPVSIGHLWLDIDGKGEVKNAACTKGFLTINDNRATIVVDSAEWKETIDVQRAREAKERAEKRLEKRNEDIDVLRAKTALRRAMNRVRISKI
jgi:F-type H+-transporting ATPase subunit epsilon